MIVPAYRAAADDAAKLRRDATALCQAPSQGSLDAARLSWRDARASWMRSAAVWSGPVMDRRSLSLLDWSPVDTGGIEETLARGRPVTAGDVRNTLAANRRGFGAMEWFLFGDDALANLSASALRCSYLTALAEVAEEETGAILSEWTAGSDGRPPYQDYFTDRASSAMLSSAAVAELVRAQVFLIRNMADLRLASALGLRGDAPDLTAIPGTDAGNGLQDIRNELLGMRAVYEGPGEDGLGLSGLVLPLSEETDRRLRDQFAAAILAIDSVEGPLRAAIVERPHQARGVYERLLDVQRTLATEVVSLLGVSVGFSDTDGDSMR